MPYSKLPVAVVGRYATEGDRMDLDAWAWDVARELVRPAVVVLHSDYDVTDFSAVVVYDGLNDSPCDPNHLAGVVLYAEAYAHQVEVIEPLPLGERVACSLCELPMTVQTSYDETGSPLCLPCQGGGAGCSYCGETDEECTPIKGLDGIWYPVCGGCFHRAGVDVPEPLTSVRELLLVAA